MRIVYFLFTLVIFFNPDSGLALTCQDVFAAKQTSVDAANEKPAGVPPSEREMLAESLDDLFELIESQYGPLGLKEESIGLNWAETKARFRSRMAQVNGTVQALFLMAELLHKLEDAHVTVQLPSTLTFQLPLQIVYAPGEDSFYLNYLDILEYPTGVRLPNLGDQLIAINGLTPEEQIARNTAFRTGGNSVTDKSLFAMTLSRIRESRGLAFVDEDNPQVELTFRSVIDGEKYSVKLNYKVDGIGLKGYELSGDASGLVEPLQRALRRLREEYERKKQETAEKNKKSTKNYLRTLIQAALPNKRDRSIAERWLEEVAELDQAYNLAEGLHKLVNLQTPDLIALNSETTEAKKNDKNRGRRFELGNTEPFLKLPKDFKRIRPPAPLRSFLNDSSIYAGTFQRQGKTVGFLRIPSYEPSNITTALHSLRYFIGRLEQESDYLIIDQFNNPGGYVHYSDWLVQTLVGQLDLDKHMKFAVKPTQDWLSSFESLIYEVNDLRNKGLFSESEVIDYEQVLWPAYDRVARLLDPDFKNSDQRTSLERWGVSEPVPLVLVSEIIQKSLDRSIWKFLGNPKTYQMGYSVWYYAQKLLGVDVFSPQVYTKPVYMLINELDFSGGDATPAVLQDYGRVKLIGVRTAGAGGSVGNHGYNEKGVLDFKFSLTESLMVRSNPEQPFVENYGVTPDIEFSLTREDFVSEFSGTLDRILGLIDKDREVVATSER